MDVPWRIKSSHVQLGCQQIKCPVDFPSMWCTVVAVIGIGIIFAVIPEQSLAQEGRISAAAGQQMRALMDEKASRTPAQRKISSSLLVTSMQRRSAAFMDAVPSLRSSVEMQQNDTVLVDIKTTDTETLSQQIQALGGTITNSHIKYQALRALVPIDKLEILADSSNVVSIRAGDQYQIHQVNTSEGDHAHAADTARTTFGVDGTGVKIGVISDSVEALASLQNSEDLPSVTVLPGQASSGTSEGTAMLEIIHDLAPGAQLFFATANGGQAQFAQNILDLGTAGCDVIVDDVGYFAEPVFQDGIIAEAVNTVIGNGAQYYSSAGNSGNFNDGTSGVWEGDFAPTAAPSVIPGQGVAHNFGVGTNFNRITRDQRANVFTLHWSDPQGGSANDYDLFLLSPDLSNVIASSTDTQDGDDNPFEFISSQDDNGNNIDDTNAVLVIIRNPGAQSRNLHLNTNRAELAIATAGQTSGHSAALEAFSVAAVNVARANGGTFVGGVANPVETFSSDGPRRIFYQADGTPITPGNFSSTGGMLRQKPDITAADGVATATPGFASFFGTSAAAPHAAAIGALMLQANSTLTPADVRTAYNTTALDIEAPGVDRDSGVGIIMADTAVEAVQPNNEPDLTVSIGGPATAEQGEDISNQIQLTAHNVGAGPAPGTQEAGNNGYIVDVVLSSDNNLPIQLATFSPNFHEDVLLKGGRVSNTQTLAPGMSITYAVGATIPADTPSGTYCLGAVVDPGKKVQESDETNNTSCHTITVKEIIPLPKPDLKVSISGPATAEQGEDISNQIQLTAHNVGAGPAPGTQEAGNNGYMVDVVLSSDNNLPIQFATFSPNFQEDVLLKGGRVSNTQTLAPGMSITYAVGATIPADTPPGNYCLGAVVDPGNKVQESNEGNNTSCHPIVVPSPGENVCEGGSGPPCLCDPFWIKFPYWCK